MSEMFKNLKLDMHNVVKKKPKNLGDSGYCLRDDDIRHVDKEYLLELRAEQKALGVSDKVLDRIFPVGLPHRATP